MQAKYVNKTPFLSPRRAVGIAVSLFTMMFVVAYLVEIQALPPGSTDFYLTIQRMVTGAALFYAARFTAARDARRARSWYFWSSAMFSVVIGDIVWWVIEALILRPPFPSLADFFYILMYLFFWIGFAVYPAEEIPHEEKKFVYLDDLVIVIGSGLVFWTFMVVPLLRMDDVDAFSYILGMAYPLLAMALLWGLLLFFRGRRQASAYPPMILLGAGIVITIFSDIFFVMTLIDSNQAAFFINAGWFLACILIALAGIFNINQLAAETRQACKQPAGQWLPKARSWPVYMPYLLVGLVYVVMMYKLPFDSVTFYMVVGTGVLIGLVIYRQIIMIRDNERLIASARQELEVRKQAQEALEHANLVLDQRVEERTADLKKMNMRLSESNTALEIEIDVREQVERSLLRQMKLEELIASISSSFINLPVEDIDARIEQALQRIGEFVGADRSYILQLFYQIDLFSNTYEWCREGIEPQKQNLQNIRASSVPWFLECLNSPDPIAISDLAELPPGAEYEKTLLEVQGIQSLCVVPLRWDGVTVGSIGFDAVRAPRKWESEDVTLLKIIGEILMMAYQRKSSRGALDRYAARLKTLHEIDQAILAEDKMENIITYALLSLGGILPCQRAALVVSEPQEETAALYMYNRAGMGRTIQVIRNDQPGVYDQIQATIDALARGEAAPERQAAEVILRSLGLVAAFDLGECRLKVTPLMVKEGVGGFLCLCLDPASLDSQEQAVGISEVTHSLAIALSQARLRQELQSRLAWAEASLHEKELLLKEIHHRVKNNLQVISSLLSLQTQVIQDEAARSALRDSQMRVRSMALIHEKLYQSDRLSKIELAPYILSLSSNLFNSYQRDNTTIELLPDVGDIAATIDHAVPLGLILNELISNSLKHAFPAGGEGKIGISLNKGAGKMLVLKYYDTGIGLPEGFDVNTSQTLGMLLIYSLSRQLEGEIILTSQDGFRFEMRFLIEDE